ncbi:DEAD/DEAH box helicase family protein [Micromonospora sp. HM5-17]|uniref:DEAD/DEAH box helicase family protein n=1 Tax=Micromonospora sp. HM5-17 TaxID=2487710 RepID=UPI0013155E90|nr:DEAD/DEAH box helicase family protein [Micromonospora sp. HM5-17]
MDPRQVRLLAAQSANFGFLAAHPLLLWYGAGAEWLVYANPWASLLRSRSFGEVLADELVRRTTVVPQGGSLHHLLRALGADGVLTPRVFAAFARLRDIGGTRYDPDEEPLVALDALRNCFTLGVWFHRALTGDRAPLGFVPPTPPPELLCDPPASPRKPPVHRVVPRPAVRGTGRGAGERLRAELRRYRTELAATRLRLTGSGSAVAAQRRAAAEADRMIAAADAARATVGTLLASLEPEVWAARRDVGRQASARISAGRREEFVARLRRTVPEPGNEPQARVELERRLAAAGWVVRNPHRRHPPDGLGVAVRNVPLCTGHADYLLYVDGSLVGVVEAGWAEVEPSGGEDDGVGTRPSGVASEVALAARLDRYRHRLTVEQRRTAWRRDHPLPFGYVSTGGETVFVNWLAPFPRPRDVTAFHRPATLARWMREADENPTAPTLRARLRQLPPPRARDLRAAQVEALRGLDRSLADDRPRALIQLAAGAGKTRTVIVASHRLLEHAGAHRVLVLVDRDNLARRLVQEFVDYRIPDDGTAPFAGRHPVERLSGATMLGSARVIVTTVPRLHAALNGAPLPDADDDPAHDSHPRDSPVEVPYHPHLPPETFDVIIVDDCHRATYGAWRGVLEYFDAFTVGLTTAPVQQTLGFHHENLVAEYPDEQAIADGVTVDFDLYRIRATATPTGLRVEAGPVVPRWERRTRAERYQEVERDLGYLGAPAGRPVVSGGELRLVLETFRDRLGTEIFPGRREVPKTLVLARDAVHADEVAALLRQIFARDDTFAVALTYGSRHAGYDPDELFEAFRSQPVPRIVVTDDLLATGVDIPALECLVILRPVRTAGCLARMKGRVARAIAPAEFRLVAGDALAKERFVVVDAVGITEGAVDEVVPLHRCPERELSLRTLLGRAARLDATPDEIATLAARLCRLRQRLTGAELAELAELGGQPLAQIVRGLVDAVAPEQLNAARAVGLDAVRGLMATAVRPLAAVPVLRDRILELHDNPGR